MSFSDSDSESSEIARLKKVAETGSDCDSDSSSKEQSRHGKRERSEEDGPSKKQRTEQSEEGTTVFVGGLSFDADEAAVQDFFGSCGAINTIRIPVFEDSGKRRGIAFIEFADAASANKAVEFDGQEMMGRWLKVNISTGKPAPGTERNGRPQGLSQRPDNCTAIFVGNLSWNASEDDLRRVFGDCGTITGCRIAVDQDSGRSKGFGHVEFDSSDAVDSAVKMSNIEIDGRTIRIDYSGPRTGGAPRGGRGGSFGGRGRGRGGNFGGDRRGGRGGFGSRGGRGGFNDRQSRGHQGKRVAFD